MPDWLAVHKDLKRSKVAGPPGAGCWRREHRLFDLVTLNAAISHKLTEVNGPGSSPPVPPGSGESVGNL